MIIESENLDEVADLGHENDVESQIWEMKLEEVPHLGDEFGCESQMWDMNLMLGPGSGT